MAVCRVEKNKNYTTMSNYHLRDPNLSNKARGLLSTMLSLPDNWDYTTRGLARICKDGVDGITAQLKELEQYGYLVRHRIRDSTGRITDMEYIIYERPHTASPDTEKPYMVKPDMALPRLETPAQINIDKRITEEINTDSVNTHSILSDGSRPSVLAALEAKRKEVSGRDMDEYREIIMENIDYDILRMDIYRLWISSMEDNAIAQGFRELKDGKEYDNLFAAARCREWADWLVGINATRLFSVLYHRTLNVGRVVSPTLAILVQREAEIGAFKPEPFYTAEIDFGGFTAASEKFKKKSEAQAAASKAKKPAVVESVTSKEKSEKAPALYDLTTLQRDANRQLGYTAQQTLDYVQSLYEKKLCTYPRTDSRYLTDDMANGVNAVVDCSVGICGVSAPAVVLREQICNSKKVSDHHAIIPTAVAAKTDLSTLPAGEREILTMIAKQVLRAVSESYRYRETVAVITCNGN